MVSRVMRWLLKVSVGADDTVPRRRFPIGRRSVACLSPQRRRIQRNALMAKDIAVAVIEPVGGHGGMDYYDRGLCRGLLAAGCRVSLYTCAETAVPAIVGLRFHRCYKRIFGPGSRWTRACRYLAGTFAALATAVAHGEKVCHFHIFQGVIAEFVPILLAKLCWRKVIITVHDVESFGDSAAMSGRTISKVYRFADRLIVHNEFSRRELIEKLNVSPAKVSTVPHGNYLETAGKIPRPVEAKRTLGLEECKKVVLFFGQIKNAKGLDLMIGAAPEVARDIPEVTFMVAGRPWKSDFSKYEALIQELGIADRFVLHRRFIPPDEVACYFTAADIVVLPYRRIYQSGVVLMAMSYRRAVVVSDLPGMTEIVRDGENGFVFASGSKEHLAKRLIEILKDDEGRARVANSGFDYVSREHDWLRIGRLTKEIYKA
jgi:D-inositol-3-phosphate glycosyltransferase